MKSYIRKEMIGLGCQLFTAWGNSTGHNYLCFADSSSAEVAVQMSPCQPIWETHGFLSRRTNFFNITSIYRERLNEKTPE